MALLREKARDRGVYSALKNKFSGVDIVPEVVRLAAMNLYLHGITGVDSIVEAKDASPEELSVSFCNSGVIAADAGLLSPELAAGIARVKGVKQLGHRSGNWLSLDQSSEVLRSASGDGLRAKRDYAMLAVLLGCGLRRSELVGLETDEIQTRQDHWAIVDLIGKGRRVRTVPIPQWVKKALDRWVGAAGITQGKIFRAVTKRGKVWGKGISQNLVWYVVRNRCKGVGLEHIAPHDLRRYAESRIMPNRV